MARFYTDHDVSVHTAAALREHGHDVAISRELHQERAADYRQLLSTAEQDRILVTHNQEDYSLLHGAWLLWSASWQSAAQHSGILIIPQWRPTLPQWAPEGAAQELADFVQAHPLLTNQLYTWRRSTGWQLLRL